MALLTSFKALTVRQAHRCFVFVNQDGVSCAAKAQPSPASSDCMTGFNAGGISRRRLEPC